jgi:transposase-like protein
MTTARVFRGFRFPPDVIFWAVRWYLQFPISYRDLEQMLADRGVVVDQTTLSRWVRRRRPRAVMHGRTRRGGWWCASSDRLPAPA